ncbi:unnamed protein product [Lactuca saligna]|uniref:Uncharacterized protein n=1 Tax=Lactuca saligna TaxID=75948 RepID=A0AA36EIA1_LACSI|nr:unnamed protein product [Lactuca saligna]
MFDDDEEEEEDLSEGAKLKRKYRGKDLDEIDRVAKEAEAREKKAHDAQVYHETQKALFPPWSMERILNEAINTPSVYWLDPVVSFDLENTLESQFDFPITLKAFLFQRFKKIETTLITDNDKTAAVEVFGPVQTKSFINIRFKAVRGAGSSIFEFTLIDLPCQNPYDWISLFTLLSKYEQKFKPIVIHLKRILVFYIQEVGKMDMEIDDVLRTRSTIQPKEALNDVSKMKLGKIRKDNWSVAFQQTEGKKVQKCLFCLPDKHLYSTSRLNYILGITKECKVNDVADKKYFADMIK